MTMLTVPGAERQVVALLDDLTTAGTTKSGHTVPSDWEGLHASGTRNPVGVPGWQVDGCFPSRSTLNTHHGWNHDAQFVMRLPAEWNGKLVVTGAPGVRRQYATDFIISDWMLARGYAYAATDKGSSGAEFYTVGEHPADALVEWNERVTELAAAAMNVVAQHYGSPPGRTYVTGISNGGYLTRWQLENNPDLYDGGVDWEGPLWHQDGPNLLTYLPAALRHYPRYRDQGAEDAHTAMIKAGFPEGSEFLWQDHYQIYWDLTQRIYRACVDPAYSGGGTPFSSSGTAGSDADYDYATRPDQVHDAVRRIALTGRLERPLLTLHGTLDALLPITLHADAYAEMIAFRGRSGSHRLYRIEGGNHVDGFVDRFPAELTPMLPSYRWTFECLERWVEEGVEPPPSTTLTG